MATVTIKYAVRIELDTNFKRDGNRCVRLAIKGSFDPAEGHELGFNMFRQVSSSLNKIAGRWNARQLFKINHEVEFVENTFTVELLGPKRNGIGRMLRANLGEDHDSKIEFIVKSVNADIVPYLSRLNRQI